MGRFRYGLSWLLLVQVVLAVLIWWYIPAPLPAFSHFAEPFDSAAEGNLYRIKTRYMYDLLVLHELQDCEYAILVIGANWSPEDHLLITNIRKTSEKYRKHIPFFIYNFDQDDFFAITPLHLPNYRPSMKGQGFVGVVHRGCVIATLSGPGEYLKPVEYQPKIDDCLPWNYKL